MPTLGSATISGFVRADDLDVKHSISGVIQTDPLTDAWLTVQDATPTQIFQKHITTSAVAGQGQIMDDGAANGTAVVRFELVGGSSGDTTKLTADLAYAYDIQVKTVAGKRYTPETGFPTKSGGMTASEQVTTA